MAQNPNPSQLDPGQITKREFDDINDAVRVNVVATVPGANSVSIVDGTGGTDKLKINAQNAASATLTDPSTGVQATITAGNALKIDGSASTQPISAASLPLPSGASTAAKQDTGNTSLASIDGKIVAVNTGAVTISSALPAGANNIGSITDITGTLSLPTGASTATKQDTGNTSLASIDGKITAVNTGAVTISSALPAGTNAIGSVAVNNASGGSAVNIQDGGNSITVDGTVAATQSGNWSSRLQDGSGNAINSTSNALNVNVQNATLTVASNLDVVDFFDVPVLDTSSTNIPASSTNPVQVVASLASDVKKIKINDTTGQFIGVYTGAALSEVLQCVVGPGEDGTIEVQMTATQRVSLRNMVDATISVGSLCIQFLG